MVCTVGGMGERYENIIMHNIQLIIGIHRGFVKLKTKNYKHYEYFHINRERVWGAGGGSENSIKQNEKVLIFTPAPESLRAKKKKSNEVLRGAAKKRKY